MIVLPQPSCHNRLKSLNSFSVGLLGRVSSREATQSCLSRLHAVNPAINAVVRVLEEQAQCILVIIGATPEGRKELIGFTDGMRESSQSWRDLLLDLKRRGLTTAPQIAVADGALG